MSETSDVEHIVWLIYRKAVRDHVARDDAPLAESEAQYRERAEKAGLTAVVNFVAKAYQADAA